MKLLRVCLLIAIVSLISTTASAYEVGVEWINSYGFNYNDPDEGTIYLGNLDGCDDDATDFYTKLGNDGWTQDFNYGDTLAWEQDFKKSTLGGTDYSLVDEQDFAFYAGHGSPTGFYFNNDHDDKKLRGTEDYHDAEWGNDDSQDLEWIALACCEVLKQATAFHGSWDDRWGYDVFKGLHLILGFDTAVSDNPNHGEVFADYMIVNEYSIKESWFRMADDLEDSGTEAAVIGVNDIGYSTHDDHLWGHGSVASDKSNPYSLFWESYTV